MAKKAVFSQNSEVILEQDAAPGEEDPSQIGEAAPEEEHAGAGADFFKTNPEETVTKE